MFNFSPCLKTSVMEEEIQDCKACLLGDYKEKSLLKSKRSNILTNNRRRSHTCTEVSVVRAGEVFGLKKN